MEWWADHLHNSARCSKSRFLLASCLSAMAYFAVIGQQRRRGCTWRCHRHAHLAQRRDQREANSLRSDEWLDNERRGEAGRQHRHDDSRTTRSGRSRRPTRPHGSGRRTSRRGTRPAGTGSRRGARASSESPPRTTDRTEPDPWNCIVVRLLAKLDRQQEFEGLRPITLLETSCKMLSQVMLRHCETCDVGVPGSAGPDPTQLGSRTTSQCSELVAVLRSTVEKATDWGRPLYVCQLDFTRAYDWIAHTAIEQAMPTRGVATPVIARSCAICARRGWSSTTLRGVLRRCGRTSAFARGAH